MIRLPKIQFPRRKAVYVFNVIDDLFGNPLWVGKVGHSVNEVARAADIETSIWQVTGRKVKIKQFFAVRLFAYRLAEKIVHGVLRPLRTEIFKGASGWTEMFRTVNVYTGVLTALALYYFGIDGPGSILYAVAVALIPRPLDMAFFVLVMALIEWALICLGCYVGWVVIVSLLNF